MSDETEGKDDARRRCDQPAAADLPLDRRRRQRAGESAGGVHADSEDRTAEIQTKSGGRFSYSYVDLSTIQEAIRGPLSANELAYTQALRVHDHRVTVETTLLHSSGEFLASELTLVIAEAADPRSVGSAITYGRRFGLTALVGIAAGDDDDAEAAVPRTKGREDTAARRPRATPTAPAVPLSPPATEYPRLTDRQRRLLFATARDHGWSNEEVHAEMERAFGVTSTGDLAREDLDQLLNLLQRRPRVRADTTPPKTGT